MFEGAMREPYIANRRRTIASQLQGILAAPAGHILKRDIPDLGLERAVGAFLIEEVHLNDRIGNLADGHVAEVHILHYAAAIGIGLDSQRAIQMWAVHVAAIHENISNITRHLAANRYTAVPVLHGAVPDHEVFAGRAHLPAVPVASRFDRDTIVTRVERTTLNQNIR